MARSSTTIKKGDPRTKQFGNRHASKYDESVCDLMHEYFSGDAYEDGDNPRRKSLFRFCERHGIFEQTLKNWATAKTADGEWTYPRLHDEFVQAQNFICADIIEGAMENRYNSNFASFLLQCDYGRIPASKTEIKADADIKAKTTITINVSDVKKD